MILICCRVCFHGVFADAVDAAGSAEQVENKQK